MNDTLSYLPTQNNVSLAERLCLNGRPILCSPTFDVGIQYTQAYMKKSDEHKTVGYRRGILDVFYAHGLPYMLYILETLRRPSV